MFVKSDERAASACAAAAATSSTAAAPLIAICCRSVVRVQTRREFRKCPITKPYATNPSQTYHGPHVSGAVTSSLAGAAMQRRQHQLSVVVPHKRSLRPQ